MKKTKFEKAQLLESKTLGYGRDLLEAVLEAQAMLERNVNQTLLAAWMCAKLK